MIKAILFDLGGVLVSVRGEAHMQGLVGERMSRDEMWEKWIYSPAVRAHETGLIDAVEFSHRIIAEMQLPTSAEQFRADFEQWIIGPFAETDTLIRAAAAQYQTALLTNISAMHWQTISTFNILPHMHHIHASYQIGQLKPDANYFLSALEKVGVTANEAIFFDDNPINVAAAKALGIQSHRVVSASEALGVLRRLELIANM
jgi:glucose-1-phosphatase